MTFSAVDFFSSELSTITSVSMLLPSSLDSSSVHSRTPPDAIGNPSSKTSSSRSSSSFTAAS